jgi:hypothetical protein
MSPRVLKLEFLGMVGADPEVHLQAVLAVHALPRGQDDLAMADRAPS